MVRNFVSTVVFFCLGAGVYWCLDFCWARMMIVKVEIILKNQAETRSHFRNSPI